MTVTNSEKKVEKFSQKEVRKKVPVIEIRQKIDASYRFSGCKITFYALNFCADIAKEPSFSLKRDFSLKIEVENTWQSAKTGVSFIINFCKRSKTLFSRKLNF